MRDSTLLKWTQNNKSNKLVGSKEKKEKKSKEDKKWLHRPENLTSGHIAYLVKFLGSTEVDQPKGIEVVKDGIRKLKFSQQLKKAEGAKTPKAELTVSVDGVTIQEPKTKKIQHQYPLNRISYCADDKAEKRFFSFIAKEADSEKHTCFVFVSDKLAEEITLTIGQAFDLAYKRFISGKGTEPETEKIARLERANTELRKRLTEVGALVDLAQMSDYLAKNNIAELAVVGEQEPPKGVDTEESAVDDISSETASFVDNSKEIADKLINFDIPSNKLDALTLNDLNDDDFDPRAGDTAGDSSDASDDFNPRSSNVLASAPPVIKAPGANTPVTIAPPPSLAPILAPPQVVPRDPTKVVAKPTNPFTITSPNPFPTNDPFGMSSFSAKAKETLPPAPQRPITSEDFSLDELDPLKI